MKIPTNLSMWFRLADLGHHVGFRMIDVLCLREKTPKRETRLVNMLWFIQKTVWKVHITPYLLWVGVGGMIPFPATCMIENFPELLPLAKPEKIFPQALYSNLRVFL